MKASIKPLQSDLLRSDSMDFFDDMFYDEVSNVMADSQSLGIADWLDSVTDVRSGAAAKPQDRQAYPIDPRSGYRPARFN
jgi:Rod binding domain-containing protein